MIKAHPPSGRPNHPEINVMTKPVRTLLAIMILGLAGCATTGSSKDTPDDLLSDAIWSKDPAKVEKCLKKGNPNGKSRSGDTLLAWAYKMKNDKAVQMLLDHGANANTSIDTFHMAVISDNVDHVRLLVSRGADVNARDPSFQRSAIHFAHSKAMLEYLLSQGADIHARDRNGQPVGYDWAAKEPELWAVFVAHGADAEPRNAQGQNWQDNLNQQSEQRNEQIRQDNAWIQQANENMRRQAESVAAEQRRRQEANAPAQDTSCGWACQNAKAAQEELQRMRHDNAYKGCIAAGGLNCQ
jgi:hypothetical protein